MGPQNLANVALLCRCAMVTCLRVRLTYPRLPLFSRTNRLKVSRYSLVDEWHFQIGNRPKQTVRVLLLGREVCFPDSFPLSRRWFYILEEFDRHHQIRLNFVGLWSRYTQEQRPTIQDIVVFEVSVSRFVWDSDATSHRSNMNAWRRPFPGRRAHSCVSVLRIRSVHPCGSLIVAVVLKKNKKRRQIVWTTCVNIYGAGCIAIF
jgi:hypothetical protein